MRYFLILAFVISTFAGCYETKGPMQRAGERVDEIGDNIAKGDDPLKKKGPLEKAGENIDDALNGDKK